MHGKSLVNGSPIEVHFFGRLWTKLSKTAQKNKSWILEGRYDSAASMHITKWITDDVVRFFHV